MATTVKSTKTRVTRTSVNEETGERKFQSFPNLGTCILDNILVKQSDAEEKSLGGIIIPEVAKEKPNRGIVYAAGPGRGTDPMAVKVGDIVLYGQYAGQPIKLKGEDYLLMKQADILFIPNE